MPKAELDDVYAYFNYGRDRWGQTTIRPHPWTAVFKTMAIKNPNIEAMLRLREMINNLLERIGLGEQSPDAIENYMWRMLLTGYYLTLLPPDSVLARSKDGKVFAVKLENDGQWSKATSPYSALEHAINRRYPECRVTGVPFLIDPADPRNRMLLSLPYLLDIRTEPDWLEDADQYVELPPRTEGHTEGSE